MDKLTVCMTGTWLSSSNVGDHAIFGGVRDSLGKFANVYIRYLTAAPDRVRALYGVEAYAPRRSPLAVLRAVASSDMLLFTGGTPFYDHIPHMVYLSALTAVAKCFRVPVIPFAISLRGISRGLPLRFVKFICCTAAFLGAREERTLEKFREYARGKVPAELLPDAATQLVPVGPDEAEGLLEREGLDPAKPILGICPRTFSSDRAFQIHHYNKVFAEEVLANYRTAFAQLARYAATDLGFQLAFLPMNTQAPDDDRVVAEQIVAEIENDAAAERVHVVRTQLGPREMKGVLGRLTAVIGVRFHSLVLSSSMETPLIAVGYASKNRSIMEYIGLGEYHTDIEHVSFDFLRERLARLLDERVAITDRLAVRRREMDHLYDERVRYILSLVARRKETAP